MDIQKHLKNSTGFNNFSNKVVVGPPFVGRRENMTTILNRID